MTIPRQQRGAVLSPCRTWRYLLWRRFASGPAVVFIGLNPSTADETEDDPTVRRCIGFARRWGFGEMRLLNLCAGRSTCPQGLWRLPDPIGPDQERYWELGLMGARKVVCCWGTQGHFWVQQSWLARLRRRCVLWCLGRNRQGMPRHPLYVPADAALMRYKLGRGFRAAGALRRNQRKSAEGGT